MPTLRIRNNTKSKQTVGLLLVLIFLLVISSSGFEHVNYKHTNIFNGDSRRNLYINDNDLQLRKLNTYIRQLENELEYLTWQNIQNKLNKNIFSALKQKIQLTPYENRSWQLLLSRLFRQNATSDETLWSFGYAMELNKWDTSKHIWLAYYCVKLSDEINESMLKNCNSLIRKLPLSKNNNRLAKMIGVDTKGFNLVLNKMKLLNDEPK